MIKWDLSGRQGSIQFSRLVVSDSLWPRELQHARPPCPSPTPGVHSDSRPSSRWCHSAISFSVIPFSPCPHLPGSFPGSWLFASGGQSIGVSYESYSLLRWADLETQKKKLQMRKLITLLRLVSWRRRWHPTPVLLPGKSHGRRSLVGCSPWGC